MSAINNEFFTRTESLIGAEALEKLFSSSVLVFGSGGVGCAVVEALVRAGIGRIGVCDGDAFAPSNINRQLFALQKNIGQNKAQVACERARDINNGIVAQAYPFFYSAETESLIDFGNYDYIADCIDNVTNKILIITRAKSLGVQVISCMGTGNKLQTDFRVADIAKTNVCPLARIMRIELKKRGITGVKAVYSEEQPAISGVRIPSSISFVPVAAGMKLAGEIVRELIANDRTKG